MKNKIWTIVKILIVTIVAIWMIFFVVDYFRARDGKKPMICLKEENIPTNNNTTYYRCTSFGYKYYEYTEQGKTTYGFGAFFLKNDIEKEIGD